MPDAEPRPPRTAPRRAALSRLADWLSRPEPWAAALLLLLFAPATQTSPPWGDGVEFTATSTILGVGHPTGYPLYSLLAKAATSLPVSSVARRMNLLSAVSMALAGALMASCVWLLARRRDGSPGDATWWAAIAAPALALLGPTGWELGTSTEAYALHLAFQFSLLRTALSLCAPKPGAASQTRISGRRATLFGAFLSGLSLCHHRMALFPIFALGLAALPLLWRTARRSPASAAKLLGGSALFFALGLTPILYLPVRAAANPPVNWGAPDSLDRLVWTLKGGEFIEHRFLQYRPGQPLSLDDPDLLRRHIGERAALARDWAAAQTLPSILRGERAFFAATLLGAALLAMGGTLLWRERPAALLCLLATFGGAFLLPFLYNIADPEGYFLAWWSAAWILAGVGLARLAGLAERVVAGRSVRWIWCALLLPGLALGQASSREHRYAIAEGGASQELAARSANLTDHYAWRLFDGLPPNAILVTTGDADIYAAWYGQIVHGLRLDVLPVGINFLRMAEYQRQLDVHPARLAGLRTGAPLPQSAREAALLLWERVVAPANAAGRPVVLCSEDPALLNALAFLKPPVPLGELLTPAERLAVQTLYPVASPPNTLYLLGG